METKRKQHIKAAQPLIPSVEIAFGERECMPQMQLAIHVRKREGHEEFGFGARFHREILVALPDHPRAVFHTDELVPPGSVLLGIHLDK